VNNQAAKQFELQHLQGQRMALPLCQSLATQEQVYSEVIKVVHLLTSYLAY
jgi:hypothetical protein